MKPARYLIFSLFLLAGLASAAPGGRVTASFQNADLGFALKYIARQMGVPIQVLPGVQGTVTLELKDVPGPEALQRVLATQTTKYQAKVESWGITVGLPDELAQLESRDERALSTTSRGGVVVARPAPMPSQALYHSSNATGAPVAAGARLPVNAPEMNTESYDPTEETGYREVSQRPLSTFSIDVDTASYSNIRRFLTDATLPPVDAVRVEEMINYFSYNYPQPKGDVPFSVTTELTDCPWNPAHQLMRVGLQGRKLDDGKVPPRNLVFLLDVSGSMQSEDKLPLVKRSLQLLLSGMGAQDRVAIVVYAGASGLVLPSTPGNDKTTIMASLEELEAGGSTNGGAGIELAYKVARENFQKGAINRVILATDGDFNVGTTDQGSLLRLIEKERESGVFLTVLGFGTGNIKDDTMELLADKGNGNYAYLDNLLEAQKVLVREAGSTLVTIAKDVKLQIEFNPQRVHSYRLVGYENRRLEDTDFDNDKKDAGELGAGHNVTALYELVTDAAGQGQPLRYQGERTATDQAKSGELALVKLRYKEPSGDTSKLIEFPVKDQAVSFAKASEDLRFAAAVAAFGMVLRDSEFKGNATLPRIREWATTALGADSGGERHEFLRLIQMAQVLKAESATR